MSARLAVTAASVAALVALVGCGSSGGPAFYVATGAGDVAYVSWQEDSSGHLTGTLTEDQVSGSLPTETLSVNSAPFTGNISNGTVSISVNGGMFGSTLNLTGTASGNILTLQIPQSDGTVQSATFTSGTLSDFNSAVDKIRRSMNSANAAAYARQQAQQQAQAQASANAQAEQTAQNDIATLQQDAAPSGNLGGDVSNFQGDIQSAQSDLATEKSDAKGDNSYCGAVQSVVGDAQSVDGDLQSVSGDVQSMTPDISTVRQDISTVRNDLASLRSSGLSAPSGAYAAIKAARANLASAILQANGYIDQMNAIESQAYSLANGMATGSCSGDGPGSPSSPIPHIS